MSIVQSRVKLVLAVASLALAASACGGPEHKESVSEAAIATTAAPAVVATASPPSASCVPPPSDLVVKDLEPGTGDSVRFRTGVMVNYTGWLYDGCKPDFKGAQFDSSQGRMPFSVMVGVGRVIRGWDQGLIGMKEHGKRLLVIPPQLGYGANVAPGGKIPPNATLVFEVTLEKIVMQVQ